MVGSDLFGVLPNGDLVQVYTLQHGPLCLQVMDYGGTVLRLDTPDRHGVSGDVVLGHDSLAAYLEHSPYFGALIGRYANRLASGAFTLDGVPYTVSTNHGPHALHGGVIGFDKVRWDVLAATPTSLTLRYVSKDGDEGYPGTLTTTVTYTLTSPQAWQIDYEATTDAPTPVNLTQHTYWNLRGAIASSIDDHVLQLHASRFTPVTNALIPTGVLQRVDETPFDFRTATPMGQRLHDADEQLHYGGGYDHNYVLDGPRDADGLVHAAQVYEPVSGRTMDVHTTEPGVQFYSGNFLDGIRGKHGVVYGARAGFCLETQHYPDSPNQATFPSTILRPGETLRSRTVYTFGVRRD